jgi:dolichol-phosphate mannosyltransferase
MQISVIVPTMNEAENIPLLLPAIEAALHGRQYEVILVDDNSQDATEAVCLEMQKKFPVKLLIRRKPENGLAGAVLHGMAQAEGEYLVVMDADLQHPPGKLLELLAPLADGSADFVMGSRYVPGGGTAEGWTFFRKINSSVATLLARPFAGGTSDPMSGFFALKRTTYLAAQSLTPLGYKIALELMCKCRVKRVKEIPIHFGLRTRGQSKLSLKQQFRYLEHLSRLYDFSYPRASPAIKFILATGISWLIGAAAYFAFLQFGMSMVAAAVLAYLPALLVTTGFHARYVRTQRRFIPRPHPWSDFAVISIIEWIACAAVAFWSGKRILHLRPAEGFFYPFLVATVVRYILRKEFLQDIRGLRAATPVSEREQLAAVPEAEGK